MMKAWAAISAAAVLVALPLSVQQAAGAVAEADTAARNSDVGADVPGLGASASDIGVVLWLSVAVVAAIAAFLVLRRSRSQLDAVGEAEDVAFPVVTTMAPSGSPLSGAAGTGSAVPVAPIPPTVLSSPPVSGTALPSAIARAAAGR